MRSTLLSSATCRCNCSSTADDREPNVKWLPASVCRPIRVVGWVMLTHFALFLAMGKTLAFTSVRRSAGTVRAGLPNKHRLILSQQTEVSSRWLNAGTQSAPIRILFVSLLFGSCSALICLLFGRVSLVPYRRKLSDSPSSFSRYCLANSECPFLMSSKPSNTHLVKSSSTMWRVAEWLAYWDSASETY